MDIHAGVIALTAMAVIAAYFSVRTGLRIFRSASKLKYYSLRRQRAADGWKLVALSLLLVGFAYWLPFHGEPLAYIYFPPSPSPSLTPTITPTPTITSIPSITLTPTITDTPSVTDTLTPTASPALPVAIEAIITSLVTPNAEAAFSPIEFSTDYDGVFAVNPQTVFQNPLGHMYGAFSYDEMIPGVQWTAIWLRDGSLVHYETKPWDGATGGYGFTDWNPPLHEWLPGAYQVQLFVGMEVKVVGAFMVEGAALTASPTLTRTSAVSPTPSRTPTATPTRTRSAVSTATP